jgi:hypothetical protein
MRFVAAFLVVGGAAAILTSVDAFVPALLGSLSFVAGGAWLVTLRCWTWPPRARNVFKAAGAAGMAGIAGQAFRVSCGDSIFPWSSMLYLVAVATIGVSFPLCILCGELVARARSAPVAIAALAGVAALVAAAALATYYTWFFEVSYVLAWVGTAGLLVWGVSAKQRVEPRQAT